MMLETEGLLISIFSTEDHLCVGFLFQLFFHTWFTFVQHPPYSFWCVCYFSHFSLSRWIQRRKLNKRVKYLYLSLKKNPKQNKLTLPLLESFALLLIVLCGYIIPLFSTGPGQSALGHHEFRSQGSTMSTCTILILLFWFWLCSQKNNSRCSVVL